MNSTGTPADSLRPEDRAKLDRLYAITADVIREYEEKHKVKVLFSTRETQEERDAWMLKSMVRQIAENNENARRAELHRQSNTDDARAQTEIMSTRNGLSAAIRRLTGHTPMQTLHRRQCRIPQHIASTASCSSY